MNNYKFIDDKGTFQVDNPELTSYLYFPIANESGVLSCVTPTLGGDSKIDQNTFLLSPVSSEDLHNNKSSRNFWCKRKDKGIWSATGKSSKQQAELFTNQKEETILEAGILWHKIKRISKSFGLTSEIISFVPYTDEKIELMVVTLKNNSKEQIEFSSTAAIPLYGRSADNIRDHRHVTSLLHRIETTKTGVILNPTLTFDERGHQKNTIVYGVFGVEDGGQAPIGFYPCVEDFIGEGGSFENPRAISCTNSKFVSAQFKMDGYEALGGIQFETVNLLPDEEKTFIISLGYGSSVKELVENSNKYQTKQSCIELLEATIKYWDEKINVKFTSGTREFDLWMHWVNFQPMLRRIYGCSFLPHHDYGKGGRGWRDLWQDCLALLIMNPNGVKNMLIDNFGGVRMDGTNATIIGAKHGEFIADRNNITRVWMDHGMWPFLTTHLYIMQSGDLDILLKSAYYFKDFQAARGHNFDKSRIYPGIPEYIGDNGRGMYHYLTGAASWLLLTVLTEMYGVKGIYGDLSLEPKLMLEQFNNENKACVELVFAGRKLKIEYRNNQLKNTINCTIKSIKIDGKIYEPVQKNIIKRCDIEALNLFESHLIQVELI